MSRAVEIEIKFRVSDLPELVRRLKGLGFKRAHARARERNLLYDFPGCPLTRRGELLRLRQYGKEWKLTHKARGRAGKHKSRLETEVGIGDGRALEQILAALGFKRIFTYEKYRAEWKDGRGTVTLDQTPIGNFAEIEGPPRWLDSTAGRLGVTERDYLTQTYATLFLEWQKRAHSKAEDMLFPRGC